MALPDARVNSAIAPTTNALSVVDWIALVLLIVGGINWGLVGAFNFDLVAAIFGNGTTLSRIVYILVGLAALYTIFLVTRVTKR
jgi:uncharacterized membrane protein YuzA (DUF378 family)